MRSSIKTLAITALTVGALVTAPAAFAADNVSNGVQQDVTGGALSTLLSGGTFNAVDTSHSDQPSNTTTPFTLTADDLTGTGAGWTVNQKVTPFVYDGTNGTNADIPAANFSITPGTIAPAGGASSEGVTATPGPVALSAVDVTVLTATAGNGVGSYTLPIDATLTVPADSRAGAYEATLTTTITGLAP